MDCTRKDSGYEMLIKLNEIYDIHNTHPSELVNFECLLISTYTLRVEPPKKERRLCRSRVVLYLSMRDRYSFPNTLVFEMFFFYVVTQRYHIHSQSFSKMVVVHELTRVHFEKKRLSKLVRRQKQKFTLDFDIKLYIDN